MYKNSIYFHVVLTSLVLNMLVYFSLFKRNDLLKNFYIWIHFYIYTFNFAILLLFFAIWKKKIKLRFPW